MKIGLILILSFFVLCRVSDSQAASAVAVATNPKGGLGYGFFHDPRLSETEVKARAIKECLNWGGRNPRVIASTSKVGFGAIIWFLRADNRLDYCAALAAPSWETAVSEGKRKAKALGGRAFKIVQGWNDGSGPKRPIVMHKL